MVFHHLDETRQFRSGSVCWSVLTKEYGSGSVCWSVFHQGIPSDLHLLPDAIASGPSWSRNFRTVPSTILSPGESATTYAQRVLELRRLRAIFGISERQWVDAQAEQARQREVLRLARLQQAESQQPAHLRSSADSLR